MYEFEQFLTDQVRTDFPKVRGYIRFESGSVCQAPVMYEPYFDEEIDQNNCKHQENRDWYEQVKEEL